MFKFSVLVASFMLMLSCGLSVHATGIQLSNTRMIFSDSSKNGTLTVTNSSNRAYLIQARIQTGPDDMSAAPFIITPPLSILKGESRQVLRVLTQENTLPVDRESLFYMVVSAIPSQSVPVADADRLSIGIRNVIKFFFRPAALGEPSETTPCKLFFRRDAAGLRITNPTPWFQTLGSLSINGKSVSLDQQPCMVSPRDSVVLPTDRPYGRISWKTITDYGGLSPSCHQDMESEVAS